MLVHKLLTISYTTHTILHITKLYYLWTNQWKKRHRVAPWHASAGLPWGEQWLRLALGPGPDVGKSVAVGEMVPSLHSCCKAILASVALSPSLSMPLQSKQFSSYSQYIIQSLGVTNAQSILYFASGWHVQMTTVSIFSYNVQTLWYS